VSGVTDPLAGSGTGPSPAGPDPGLFWPNETVWHVAAATEATQGLPAWLMRDYVP
jgi:hypothetical protein